MVTIGLRAQREWVKDRPPAIFFGTLGAATFIVSLLLNVYLGLVIGWVLIVLIKLPVIAAYTPQRSHLRHILNGLKHSWVSRGTLAIALFAIFGGLYALQFFGIVYPYAVRYTLYALSLIFAGFVLIYDGFVQAVNKPITSWANGALPIIFPSFAFLSALLLINSIVSSNVVFNTTLPYIEIALVLTTYSLATHLWSANIVDIAGHEAVNQLIRGSLRGVFITGIVLSLVITSIFVNILAFYYIPELLYANTALDLIGMYLIIYSIIKVGIYKPLLYPWSRPAKV